MTHTALQWAAMLGAFAVACVAYGAEPSLPASPGAGAEAFERLGCAGCHVIGDRPSPRGYGPNLSHVDLRTTFFGGATALWNHAPGMYRRMQSRGIDLPSMTGEDLLNVVGFITAYQYYLTRVGRRGSPGRGRLLFREKACHQCHSLEKKVVIRGPSLYNFGKGRSVLELAQAMWNHGPKMQAMLDKHLVQRPFFREGEMADLLSYLSTLQVRDSVATAFVEPGDPAQGAIVFEEHHCSACHGVGEKPAPLELRGQDQPAPVFGAGKMAFSDYTDIAAQMWNHAVPMWGRMSRYGISVEPLKDTELADLVAYLYLLDFSDKPADLQHGREVFLERGCTNCHDTEKPNGGTPEVIAKSRWDLLARMWSAVPKMIEKADEMGLDWPKLQEGDLRDLSAFVLDAEKKGAFALPPK